MAALYIHIPFCKSRCSYCGFFSVVQPALQQAYTDALCREMLLARLPQGEVISTVYLGGGTPSQLSPTLLRRILEEVRRVYPVAADAEWTVECNPDDVTHRPELADLLAPLRVSMGAQTFSDDRLRQIGRRHSAAQVGRAVGLLRQAGVQNISLDLMYGFPGQTVKEWLSDVDSALALCPEHLSAYCLSYEENTPLWRRMQRGEITPADEETERQMYYALLDRMDAQGYDHYEISNFARRPALRSRHNSSYWHDVPYLGLGAGAHEYSGSERRWNVSNVRAYIEAVNEGRRPQEGETIDAETRYNEAVMLRLRTSDGLPLGLFTPEQRRYCLREADSFLRQGLLQLTGERLTLTRRGLFVSDMVMAGLML